VNPENDYLDRFVGYILEFAESLLSESSIRYRVDMPAAFPHVPLSSETRHHLLLVLKETLNNVVKHSEASEVHLRFQLSGSVFVLEVEDNGKGFTPAASGFGNGLKNMEERIHQMGGRFQLVSATGNGTRVRLELSLNINP
jgi:signal transduction histidine kinase